MKSLFALLMLGLILGGIYWKAEHPDAGVTEIKTGASTSIDRIKTGINAFAEAGDGADGSNAIAGRLDSIEADLLETKNAIDPASTQSRIESLEAALVETQQESADPAVINGRLTDAERRMSASETQLSEVKQSLSQLGNLSASTDTTTAQVASIESRVELLSRRIDEQSDQLNADSINKALAELDTNISTLQDQQRRNNDEQTVAITNMSDKIDSFEARLNTLSSDASAGQENAAATINAQIDQRIASLESQLDGSNSDKARLDSMTSELSASRVKVQALEQSVASTNEQVLQMTRNLSSLQTQSNSTSIDDQQEQIRSQLAQLQTQMDQSSDNTNVSALTSALQVTRDRIESLEKQVVNLPASSSAADDATQAQSALEAQINTLEKKLASVEANNDLRAQQQAAQSIEYRVFFDRNSTTINDEASLILNEFIKQEKDRTTGVAIYGFTDRRGDASYNQRLALRRATNVRSYLIQNGFSFTKIQSLSGLGEDAAAAVIADGEEDAQQRAVVLFAQQP